MSRLLWPFRVLARLGRGLWHGARDLLRFLWTNRLYFWIVVVALVWLAYQRHTTHRNDPYDRINLAISGIAYIVGGLVQLAFTRDWPARTVGVLFTALGTGTLYVAASLWRDAPEWVIDISRSLLNVGGPLFMLGAIAWAIHERRAERAAILFNGQPDRRNGEPGRRAIDYQRADVYGRRMRDQGDG